MVRIQAAHALLPTGWARDIELSVARDGRIAAIGPQQQPDPEHVVPLLLPAPVNLHSHTFQRAMAGLTETRGPDPRDSFWSWRKLMYRFLEHLTPDHVEAIAAQAFVEMAEAGYGAVAEFHYLHHGPGGQAYDNPGEMAARIAAAAQEVGIGLTLLPVLYQHGGCDRRALAGGQLRFGTNLDPFAELFQASAASVAAGPADWRIGVAPHSLRAVDADGLDLAETLSGAGPIHIHVAEQQAEVDEVEAHMGARPVAWMLDRRDVSERWCLIHCTQMTADETTALAASGAVAGPDHRTEPGRRHFRRGPLCRGGGRLWRRL